MRQRDNSIITWDIVLRTDKGNVVTACNIKRVTNLTNPVFWSLQVSNNANGPPDFGFNLTNKLHPFGMVLMTAMREIQPEQISTCCRQSAYHLGIR